MKDNTDWRKAWDVMHGEMPTPNPVDAYKAMETALQGLAGQIVALRTELLVIKGMLGEKAKTNE